MGYWNSLWVFVGGEVDADDANTEQVWPFGLRVSRWAGLRFM